MEGREAGVLGGLEAWGVLESLGAWDLGCPNNFWLHIHYQTDNINDNYQNKLKPVALITVPGSGTMTIEFFISQLNNRNFISIERNHYPSNSELRLIVRDGYNLHYHRMLKKKHIDFIKSAGYIILIATRNIEEIQESRIRHRAEQRSWVPYSFNKKTDRRLDDSRKIIERKFEADMIVEYENLKRDDKSVLSSINRRFFHQNKNFENQVYRAYSEIIDQGGLHYRKKSAN